MEEFSDNINSGFCTITNSTNVQTYLIHTQHLHSIVW